MRRDSGTTCARCRFFDGDAASLEATLAGLRVLGSGYASVRDEDGICALRQRFASARSTCADFAPVSDRAVTAAVVEAVIAR